MSHYDSGLVQGVETWRETLYYSPPGQIWFAHVAGYHIVVPEQVYSQLLTAYLQSYGVTQKTYVELFAPAQQQWREQCELEFAFRKDMQCWLFSHVPGVIIQREK